VQRVERRGYSQFISVGAVRNAAGFRQGHQGPCPECDNG
jgi:hypothetical protein